MRGRHDPLNPPLSGPGGNDKNQNPIVPPAPAESFLCFLRPQYKVQYARGFLAIVFVVKPIKNRTGLDERASIDTGKEYRMKMIRERGHRHQRCRRRRISFLYDFTIVKLKINHIF